MCNRYTTTECRHFCLFCLILHCALAVLDVIVSPLISTLLHTYLHCAHLANYLVHLWF